MIRFVVRSKWDEDSVARRVAAIIGEPNPWGKQEHECPYQRDGKWQLDSGNNWFMNKVGENEYELRWRYSESHQAALDGLKLFLEMTFS